RYRPDLGFYDRMGGVARGFSEKFPDWERSPLTVEVRNKKKHRRLFLTHRRCFYETDLRTAIPAGEYEAAQSCLETICAGLEVSDLQRIGVRQWFAADLGKTFALMVDELESRFLKKDNSLSAILADKTEDLAYVVDYETTDGWNYHLRLGPMTRDEWFRRFPYEVNMFEAPDEDDAATFEDYRASLPDNFLYIDVDCYQENVSAQQLKELVQTFRHHSHKLAGDLIKYCGGNH
ncbi:MAG: hypothetical protein ACC628_12955, partial [Pirellulaceae bacterium]